MHRTDPERGDDPLDQRRLEPGLARRLPVGVAPGVVVAEELLDVAEGETALLGGAADLGQRVTPFA